MSTEQVAVVKADTASVKLEWRPPRDKRKLKWEYGIYYGANLKVPTRSSESSFDRPFKMDATLPVGFPTVLKRTYPNLGCALWHVLRVGRRKMDEQNGTAVELFLSVWRRFWRRKCTRTACGSAPTTRRSR